MRRHARRTHAHIRERGRSGHVIEVFNLSSTGCNIDTSAMSGNFNAPIWLRLGDVSSLPAKLVWSNGQRGGLQFDNPLHEAVLERIVAANDQCTYSEPDNPSPKDVVADTVGESRSEQIKRGYVEPPLLMRKNPIGKNPLDTLVVRHVARNTDHRLENRYPAEITSSPSHVSMKDATAKVYDISPSGMGLVSDAERGIGDAVEVAFLNCEAVKGRVIWRKGERFGVEFDENAIEIKEEG